MSKVLYYVLFGFVVILGVYYVISSLFGHFSLWSAPPLVARIILVIAAIAAGRILYWAYQVGEVQNRWLVGAGVVLLALLSFQAILLLGAVTLGRKG
jgi:putative effector of murein hydrolase